MNSALLLSLALAATPAAPAAPAAPPAPARRVLNRVAALVNGQVVTLQEIEQRAGSALRAAEEYPAGPTREKARAEALQRAFDAIVSDKLFEEKAKELEIEVTDQQVDAAIEGVKKQNGFSDAQFEQALRAEGMEPSAYRARIRRELQTFQLLQYKVGSKVKASDEDLRNYYQSHPQEFEGAEELHVRHIFLPLAEGASEAEAARVRAEGERILQRLKVGEDFAKVAREVSKGPSAPDGGDLGWLRRGTIQPDFEDAAFALETGRFSGLVRVGAGLHVIKVEDRRRGGARTFEEAKEEIRTRLMEEQGESYRQQFVAELRRDALVDVKLAELKP